MEKDDEPPQPCSLESAFNLENNLPAFGITREGLNILSEPEIRTAYRGMHNINIPLNALAKMNPNEIIAVSYFAGMTKRFNSHHETINQERFSMECPETIQRVCTHFKEFRNGSYTAMCDNLDFFFDSNKGFDKDRYNQIPKSDQEAIKSSYASRYNLSTQEFPWDKSSYFEPETKEDCIDYIYCYFDFKSRALSFRNHKNLKTI